MIRAEHLGTVGQNGQLVKRTCPQKIRCRDYTKERVDTRNPRHLAPGCGRVSLLRPSILHRSTRPRDRFPHFDPPRSVYSKS